MTATHTTVDSPIGELTLVADEGKLTGVYFPHHWYRPDPATFGPRTDTGSRTPRPSSPSTSRATGTASTWPSSPEGDEFQRRVWDLIAGIPYGETVTYGDLARDIGARPRPRTSARPSGATR